MKKKSTPCSVEQAVADRAAAEAATIARANRLEELQASVAAINSDLTERRDSLSDLAEDSGAFREALAFIAAEEDRARVISDTLIPAAVDALATAERDERKADKAHLVALAVAELERMEAADDVTKAVAVKFAEALSQSLEIRNEIQPVVCAEGTGFGFDPIHAGNLYSALPPTVRVFFRNFAPKDVSLYAAQPVPI